jgi:hypothetical protein
MPGVPSLPSAVLLLLGTSGLAIFHDNASSFVHRDALGQSRLSLIANAAAISGSRPRLLSLACHMQFDRRFAFRLESIFGHRSVIGPRSWNR